MYNSYILHIFLVFAISSFGQNNFSKYENMQDVSSMVMDSNMFRLLSQIDLSSSDPETKAYLELVENIENVKIFSSEKNTVRQTMKTDVQTYLKNSQLEELLSSNDNGQKIQLYAKPSSIANHVSELLIFLEDTETSNSQNSTLVSITGNIDVKQIFKLARDLDIPGSTMLKKLGN